LKDKSFQSKKFTESGKDKQLHHQPKAGMGQKKELI
jgi:hypothetical protein